MAYPASTAVAELDHGRVDTLIKHLRQPRAVLVDPGGLLVVDPGIVKHQPHVTTELQQREREGENGTSSHRMEW